MNNFITYVCPKGELSKDTEKLLYERFGIITDLNGKNYTEFVKVDNTYTRRKIYRILKFRSWDVPAIVRAAVMMKEEGNLKTYGITGRDVYENYKILNPDCKLKKLEDLDYGFARISVLSNKGIFDFNELKRPIKVVTPYVGLAKKFFEDKCYNFSINEMPLEPINGSWEALVKLNWADIVVDVVNEGKTKSQNDLIELFKILDSNAVLITSE